MSTPLHGRRARFSGVSAPLPTPSDLASVMVVVVVLEVRRVAVDERVPVLVKSVKDPEPRHAAQAVRPKLVKHARLVKGQALVRDARSAAACAAGARRRGEEGGPKSAPRKQRGKRRGGRRASDATQTLRRAVPFTALPQPTPQPLLQTPRGLPFRHPTGACIFARVDPERNSRTCRAVDTPRVDEGREPRVELVGPHRAVGGAYGEGREEGARGGAQKKQSPWQSLLIVTCSHQRWGRVGASYPWRASAGPRCAAGRTRAPRAREPPRPVAERRPRIPSLNEPPSSLQGARRQWHRGARHNTSHKDVPACPEEKKRSRPPTQSDHRGTGRPISTTPTSK